MENRTRSLPNDLGNFNESPATWRKNQLRTFSNFSAVQWPGVFSAYILNELRETLNETPHVLPKPLFSWEKIFPKKA
jgi:hypothetical protein